LPSRPAKTSLCPLDRRKLKSSSTSRAPGFQALCANASSGAVRLLELGRCAPIGIRAPCALLDFRHCVPMRALALCVFSSSGAVRRLKSARLARSWISGTVCQCELRRCAPSRARALCAD
jgi:hypothetical protein